MIPNELLRMGDGWTAVHHCPPGNGPEPVTITLHIMVRGEHHQGIFMGIQPRSQFDILRPKLGAPVDRDALNPDVVSQTFDALGRAVFAAAPPSLRAAWVQGFGVVT